MCSLVAFYDDCPTGSWKCYFVFTIFNSRRLRLGLWRLKHTDHSRVQMTNTSLTCAYPKKKNVTFSPRAKGIEVNMRCIKINRLHLWINHSATVFTGDMEEAMKHHLLGFPLNLTKFQQLVCQHSFVFFHSWFPRGSYVFIMFSDHMYRLCSCH